MTNAPGAESALSAVALLASEIRSQTSAVACDVDAVHLLILLPWSQFYLKWM